MLLIIPHLDCNIFCYYCYEKRYRQKNKTEVKYNLATILSGMERLRKIHPEMCLHGGEPLMIPKEDVRSILLKIKELTGRSSIQTNGTLIDDDFIKIFKECQTNVGLSYDGPGKLSEYRFHRLKEDPEIDKKITKMLKEGINISMITVITKANAGTNERLEKLKKYLLKLDKLKISGRLNPCGGAPECELSDERRKEVYLDLANFCLQNNLKWSPFTDIINALQGKSRVCTFMGCDPFCTPSAAEMLDDGQLTSCMRTNQEYILLRHPVKYETRHEILYQTPQEWGGCQGCQYWQACYGGCPTMAINNDWRNKTYLCSLWKTLFAFYEKVLRYCDVRVLPGDNLCKIEKKTPQQERSSEYGKQVEHQDHTDDCHNDVAPSECKQTDFEHGDSEHGDQIEHQNHTDDSHNDVAGSSKYEHGDSEHGDSEHGDSEHGDWADHGDSDQQS